MAATIFAILVTIVIVGWLWFYIVRPILEDYGVITPQPVNYYQAAPSEIMSSAPTALADDPLSSQDGQPDGRTDSPTPSRAELLTLYRILRKYGVPREEIRAALRGVRVPLSNDVWASAAPAEPQYTTPIAGRPTSAAFDPDFPYEPLT